MPCISTPKVDMLDFQLYEMRGVFGIHLVAEGGRHTPRTHEWWKTQLLYFTRVSLRALHSDKQLVTVKG